MNSIEHHPNRKLPPKNSRGNFPAIAATDALISQGIVKNRKAAGLTQRELARLAGIRVETLNRAERGVVVPDLRTLRRIETALSAVRSGKSKRKKYERQRPCPDSAG